jgi:hypothetical protein
MTNSMFDGRRADSARRRERVTKALDTAVRNRNEINVSAIARAAGVDRTFLYRHRDLLSRIHQAAAEPPGGEAGGQIVSRASLHADLAAAQDRHRRQDTRIRQLERKLGEALGEQVWQDSGLGGPTDIEQLQRRITLLEQQVVELRGQLDDRAQELDAARAANRELTRSLNQIRP